MCSSHTHPLLCCCSPNPLPPPPPTSADVPCIRPSNTIPDAHVMRARDASSPPLLATRIVLDAAPAKGVGAAAPSWSKARTATAAQQPRTAATPLLARSGSSDGRRSTARARQPRSLAFSVTAAAYAPNGRHLYTGGADGTVKVWDLRMSYASGRRNEPVATVDSPRLSQGRPWGGVTSLSLSGSGDMLAAGYSRGGVVLHRGHLPLGNAQGGRDTALLGQGAASEGSVRVPFYSPPLVSPLPPATAFENSRPPSFYIKARLSLDGRYLASGAVEGGSAFVWDVRCFRRGRGRNAGAIQALTLPCFLPFPDGQARGALAP